MRLETVVAILWRQMADAVFSKGPEPHGTRRDAIDNEFSGWLTMPGSFSAARESTMASCRRDRPNRGTRRRSNRPSIGFLSRCRKR